jgi:hypothetical protein
MLDRQDQPRRPAVASGGYWSAVINPALLSFNDLHHFLFYQRNLAAMQHHFQQQELFRQHYSNCFCDKKRPATRNDAESPKPKRAKMSEAAASGTSKPPRPTAAGLDHPEDLRSETTTPTSNRSGLITFRPHSDLLTSCLETSAGASKSQQLRKKSEAGEARKSDGGSAATAPSLSSKNLSSLLSSTAEAWEEGDGAISRLFPEILSMIFEYLDLSSKGRAAQVTSQLLIACQFLLDRLLCQTLNFYL